MREALLRLPVALDSDLESLCPVKKARGDLSLPYGWDARCLPSVLHGWVQSLRVESDFGRWMLMVAVETLLRWKEWMGVGDHPQFEMPRAFQGRDGSVVLVSGLLLPLDQRWARPLFVAYDARGYFGLREPGWEPLFETWRAFRARAEAALRRSLKTHKQLRQQEQRVTQKRYPSADLHLSWLVRYHVRGESYGQIANYEVAGNKLTMDEKRRHIDASVKVAASRIGLRLRRKGRGGQPRRKK